MKENRRSVGEPERRFLAVCRVGDLCRFQHTLHPGQKTRQICRISKVTSKKLLSGGMADLLPQLILIKTLKYIQYSCDFYHKI